MSALLLVASLTAADIRAEMVSVERRLIELGYDKVKGASEALPVPTVTLVPYMAVVSEVSYHMHEIAILNHPDSCIELRLQYELANYEMIWAYRDTSEKAAHQIADGYEPWSPNCMKIPSGGTLGAMRGSFAP